MNKSLYVDIPVEVYETLRHYCFEQNITKKEVIVAAILNYCRNKPSKYFNKAIGSPENKGETKLESVSYAGSASAIWGTPPTDKLALSQNIPSEALPANRIIKGVPKINKKGDILS